MYQDEILKCVDCAHNFAFSAGEQTFFAEKGFTNKPNRCQDCRRARKAHLTLGSPTQSSGPDLGPRVERSDREMFSASCTDCGNTTQVPFKPLEGKPVYCRSCFSVRRLAHRS